MYYTAASVFEAIKKCSKLKMINDNLIFCPKDRNSECPSHPNCSGENLKCMQKLEINGVLDSYLGFLEFSYYTGIDSRGGRIKKMNSTLGKIVEKYKIDTNIFASV